ncbi:MULTISPECIES: iron-containing alcohol dehydrogenase [Vibrio]|uniref:iron-containing alcohol dehydrogenase n=1 Tax=Vibrio TaxID=662 RepID=UPI000C16C3EE|nr:MULTISPECIES: iron-containing alcohol dehydrogenase [Vibrio]NAW70170.1 iron-containing alcohol dehydrogenase [Vibrio sp. V28_P6S34P95]NAX04636.1 iron-containing alcohol dehydrogenase [Vibrio sp. V30_P3S12P165]NNN45228.1 iron-containing alcohol dehydrogenase [Vibrio sp. 1-1(7)]NNN72601.1 iron-containing alcohol dehydrogenase [Vibrio sp. 12-2(3-a)]
MSTNIVLPRIMHIGKGAAMKVVEVMNVLKVHAPLIVTDNMMVKLGYAEQVQQVLRQSGIESMIYSETVPEPTVSSIQAGVDLVRSSHFDSIIALGGGSPIDSAKAISIVGKFGGQVRDYRFPKNVADSGLPIIAIPTTAGTGSEVTRVTVITDDQNDEKMLCMGLGFMPMAALIDYELTLSLPPRVTADCGLDALTHAIEAYVSQKANPFTDAQALSAIELIGSNLRYAFDEPHNEAARAAMMLGATLAGIAFSNASVALVHGMSRPIGAFFHVPHGLSNAMLLPVITEYSIPAANDRYADCARAMGVALLSDDNSVACQKLLTELRLLNTHLNVPSPSSYGIEKDKFFDLLPTMAQQALDSGSPLNNPKVPTIEEMIELYRKVWMEGER